MSTRNITLGVAAAVGVGAGAYFYLNKDKTEEKVKLKNSAFVFIKPAANTAAVQKVVSETLKAKGCKIVNEGEFTGEQIDKGKLIDQHYYAIASKATILAPKDIPVPNDKFNAKFGLDYSQALSNGSVYNAIDACTLLGVDANGLDKLWAACDKVKLGGGFYCGKIEHEGKSIYCFNAFFMQMRSGFVAPGSSIHYYVVDFDPETLSWADFRGKVLGPTDPKDAPKDSLRGAILGTWKECGLAAEPNVGENCVHASASPFEALAEKMNWLKVKANEDAFGKAMLKAVPESMLNEWTVDPQVTLATKDGKKSIFDQLEDMDADVCVAQGAKIAAANSK